MSARYAVAVVFLVSGLVAGCSPSPGSQAWCEKMSEKPQGQWSMKDAEIYAENCVFSRR